jgi:hypothetical protein
LATPSLFLPVSRRSVAPSPRGLQPLFRDEFNIWHIGRLVSGGINSDTVGTIAAALKFRL